MNCINFLLKTNFPVEFIIESVWNLLFKNMKSEFRVPKYEFIFDNELGSYLQYMVFFT